MELASSEKLYKLSDVRGVFCKSYVSTTALPVVTDLRGILQYEIASLRRKALRVVLPNEIHYTDFSAPAFVLVIVLIVTVKNFKIGIWHFSTQKEFSRHLLKHPTLKDKLMHIISSLLTFFPFHDFLFFRYFLPSFFTCGLRLQS